MTDAITMYIDEIGQALVQELHTALPSLGLTVYEQGTLAHLPAPEDLDSSLPALFVCFEGTEQFELFMAQRFRVRYRFKVRYCERQIDGANPTRNMAQRLSLIAAAVASSRFSLLSLEGTPGLDVMKVQPTKIDLDNEEHHIMSLPEIRVSVGHIDLVVEAETTTT
jgi:hypothetical protein